MPEPNIGAQKTSQQLLYALDKLNSKFSQHPDARELLQLDQQSPIRPDKGPLVRTIFKIGQGTHNPDEVNENQVIEDAFALAIEAQNLYNRLFFEAQNPNHEDWGF